MTQSEWEKADQIQRVKENLERLARENEEKLRKEAEKREQ